MTLKGWADEERRHNILKRQETLCRKGSCLMSLKVNGPVASPPANVSIHQEIGPAYTQQTEYVWFHCVCLLCCYHVDCFVSLISLNHNFSFVFLFLFLFLVITSGNISELCPENTIWNKQTNKQPNLLWQMFTTQRSFITRWISIRTNADPDNRSSVNTWICCDHQCEHRQ